MLKTILTIFALVVFAALIAFMPTPFQMPVWISVIAGPAVFFAGVAAMVVVAMVRPRIRSPG